MSDTDTHIPETAERFKPILWGALVILLILQIRWPMLSYPEAGILQLCGLCAVLAGGWLLRDKDATLSGPTAFAGACFLGWAVFRWGATGFRYAGADDVGTFIMAGIYATGGFLLTRGGPGRLCGLLWAVVLVAVAGAGHGLWQFLYGYDAARAELESMLAGRVPDQTQAALLYHFNLKRIAGVWGDPNNFAAFSALGLAAGLGLWFDNLSQGRCAGGWAGKLAAVVAAAACALTIYLSGSRGGVLDVVLVAALWAGWYGWNRRFRMSRRVTTVIFAAVAVFLMATPTQTVAQPESTTHNSPPAKSWTWRSDTINERLHYATVGWRMISQHPVAGSGPGSVDLMFGRLKPPEARETKYLHNWVLQTGAELGLTGLALTLLFLVLVMRPRRRGSAGGASPMVFSLRAMLIVFLADALIQVSWNNRELMSVVGLLCGSLIAVDADVVPGSRGWKRHASGAWLLAIIGAALLIVLPDLQARRWMHRATDFAAAGQLREANDSAAKAARAAPRDPGPVLFRSGLALSAGNISAANMLAAHAVQLEPESANARAHQGDVLLAAGQTDKALAAYHEALKRYPSNPEFHYKLALYFQRAGDLPRALHHADKAVGFSTGLPHEAAYKLLREKMGKDAHE